MSGTYASPYVFELFTRLLYINISPATPIIISPTVPLAGTGVEADVDLVPSRTAQA